MTVAMKVLLVEQLATTSGRDTLALADRMNALENIIVDVYASDNAMWLKSYALKTRIEFGFHGAYEGNFLHKVFCYLKSLIKLSAYIRNNNYDIVHLQKFSLPWIEWIFVLWLRITKKRVVITIHDVIPFDRHALEISFLDIIYKEADMLLLHTELARNLFHNTYKAKTKTKLITQAFCDKAEYHLIDKETARSHFGIPRNAIVFLYYGTIRPSKGLNILFSSIRGAGEINDSVFLLATGAFHHVDEEAYKTMARGLEDDNRAIVNFGWTPQEEEQWYFSAADVLCLPYLELTQSGVAQLGLMYELPMIATDVGAMSEVVRDGENGLLISPNDEGKLTESILKLSKDSDMREQFSLCSKRLAETEFSLVNKAKRVVEAYREIEGE